MTPDTMSTLCPLCAASGPEFFHRDAHRSYFQCGHCRLVFVPSRDFPSRSEERAYYDLHENDPRDPRYRRFLSRLFVPLTEKLSPGAQGLDFGCGPGPALSMMLAEAGFPTALYDPFYEPDPAVWELSYDFITATEVVEHLHHPGVELRRLWGVLKPRGWLGVMTKRVLDREAFVHWHYKSDPTHVAFFAEETFRWLAKEWSARLEVSGPDVVFLQKPAGPDEWQRAGLG